MTTRDAVPALCPDMLERVKTLEATPAVAAALQVCETEVERAMAEQIHIAEIESPTFAEKVRGEEIMRLMREYGLKDVVMDPSGNVVGRRPGKGNGPLLAIGAHMDTVFPEGTPIKVRREGNRYYGPGIGDNCSGLRAMLEVLRAMQKANLETEGDILFIGTVGEEGNGDIRGSKHLFNTRKDIDGFLAVDNTDVTRILHTAIGAHRWRVTVQGTGGHSYAAFGKVPSAIHAVCMAGAKIAHIKVPEAPVTTFTIGTIKGGTSVNTIAPSCSVDIDVRSFENGPIEAIDKEIVAAFQEAIEEEHRIWGITDPEKKLNLIVEQIGDRPAGIRPHDCPVIQASRAAQKALGIELKNYGASSTDANMPVSLGIPATCLSAGGCQMKSHTIHEYYDDIDPHLGPQLVLLTALELVGLKGETPTLPKRS